MRLNKLSAVGVAAATCLLVGTAAVAQQLVLPPANALTTGLYGNFNVQSLELNAKCQAAGDPLCNPSGPYPVQSSPGQIADYLLILQGGSTALNYPSPLGPALVGDNAFVPPSGTPSTFVMSAANEPTPTFTGDLNGTWEVQLGALLKYLTQPSGQVADLVFLFDNNQQGSGFNQFQYAWATASIRDAAGNVVGGQCYGLFGGTGYGGGTCANPTPVAPTFDPVTGALISSGDYVALATDFCVNKAAPYDTYKLGLAGNNGDCAPDAGHPAGGYFVSNNLGQNNAEFAAYNTSLQAYFLAHASENLTLSVNIRLAHLNDGNEQVWICSACGLNRLILIPEPGSFALVGLALAGLGIARRRRIS